MDNNCLFTNSDRVYYAVDFLIYSLMGISLNDFFTKKENVIEFILDRVISSAYRDASRHVLSKKNKEDMGCNSDKEWKDKRKSAQNAIRIHIQNLCNNPPTVDDAKVYQEIGLTEVYDIWHYQLCMELLNIYNNDSKPGTFCIGIAQKWINITMKYLIILNSCMFIEEDIYTDENDEDKRLCDMFPKEIDEMITKYIHLFHIPLDGYIKNALNSDKNKSLIGEEGYLTDYYRYPKGKGISVNYIWSKINDYKDYFDIQKKIRIAHNESLSKPYNSNDVPFLDSSVPAPIDWESTAWIAEAMAQRDKEMK